MSQKKMKRLFRVSYSTKVSLKLLGTVMLVWALMVVLFLVFLGQVSGGVSDTGSHYVPHSSVTFVPGKSGTVHPWFH